MLTCAACGNTWRPASGASCPACLARGRGRKADGKLLPDQRWHDPTARTSGMQASLEALRHARVRKPKPEKKHKFCKRCEEEITVGDYKSFCEPCRLEQTRDTSMARYYRLKSESCCPSCKAPVVSAAVLCESCKARLRATPTTERDKRTMKLCRKRLHASRQARGRCIYCDAPNTTQYLGCAECLTYRSGVLRSWLAVRGGARRRDSAVDSACRERHTEARNDEAPHGGRTTCGARQPEFRRANEPRQKYSISPYLARNPKF